MMKMEQRTGTLTDFLGLVETHGHRMSEAWLQLWDPAARLLSYKEANPGEQGAVRIFGADYILERLVNGTGTQGESTAQSPQAEDYDNRKVARSLLEGNPVPEGRSMVPVKKSSGESPILRLMSILINAGGYKPSVFCDEDDITPFYVDFDISKKTTAFYDPFKGYVLFNGRPSDPYFLACVKLLEQNMGTTVFRISFELSHPKQAAQEPRKFALQAPKAVINDAGVI